MESITVENYLKAIYQLSGQPRAVPPPANWLAA